MKEWEESVLEKAIEKYGVQKQTDKAIEEMSELTKAIIKNRIYNTEQTRADILEETADVENMCKQMRLMYDNGAVSFVDSIKKSKLRRLERRMEGKQ